MQRYDDQGFAVVRGVFAANELEVIEAEVDHYLDEQIAAGESRELILEATPGKAVRCAFGMDQRSVYFDALMRDRRLYEVVRELWSDAEALADGTMLINKAPFSSYEFPWHQDNAYQFWSPPEAVALTLALDDSSAESGAIVCLAGSHQQEILPHRPSGVLGASRGLVEMPKDGKYPEVTLSLHPGDLSLHHVNTIHRTGPNRTSKNRRNLGFAYRSSRSLRNEAAMSQYERDLKQFLDAPQRAPNAG